MILRKARVTCTVLNTFCQDQDQNLCIEIKFWKEKLKLYLKVFEPTNHFLTNFEKFETFFRVLRNSSKTFKLLINNSKIKVFT